MDFKKKKEIRNMIYLGSYINITGAITVQDQNICMLTN